MTIATIREFRCEMGCGAIHQTESRFDPKGWLTVSFGTFGEAKTEHHLCPTCGPIFRASMQPVQKMHDLDGAPKWWVEISDWLENTFGPITPCRMVERAEEEFDELRKAVNSGESGDDIDEEAADVVMCLMRRPGLWSALLRKYAINQGRRWQLHGDGTGHHIKEDPNASD